MIRKEDAVDAVYSACQAEAAGRASSNHLQPANTLGAPYTESLAPAMTTKTETKGELCVLMLGMFIAAIGFVLVAIGPMFPGSAIDLVGVAFLGAGAAAAFLTAPDRSFRRGVSNRSFVHADRSFLEERAWRRSAYRSSVSARSTDGETAERKIPS